LRVSKAVMYESVARKMGQTTAKFSVLDNLDRETALLKMRIQKRNDLNVADAKRIEKIRVAREKMLLGKWDDPEPE
jgi:hypothetical protein